MVPVAPRGPFKLIYPFFQLVWLHTYVVEAIVIRSDDCPQPWPSLWQKRRFRRWVWPWRLLDVLLLALDDRRDSGYVTGFVGGCPPFVVTFVVTAVVDLESIATVVVDRFCSVRWR